MTKQQFENGKIYVLKGCIKPYGEIFEAAIYKSKNDAGKIEEHLMLDRYYFDDRLEPETQGRVYCTGGSLEPPSNFNRNDFFELGNTEDLFIIGDACLFEKKPTYKTLEAALQKIAKAKNSDFNNWKQRGDKMQQIAQKALRA